MFRLLKKKELRSHFVVKPLTSYLFFDDIVKFIRSYWQKRIFFFPGYTFINPRLNQGLKWGFDYITLVKRSKPSTKKWTKS